MVKKQDSPCLFCGGNPCMCDGTKKKKSSHSTRKVSSESTSKKSLDSTHLNKDTAVETEDVFGEIPTQEKPKFKFQAKKTVERDLSLESALLIIRPLVRDAERRNIDAELKRNYPRDLDMRIADWKKRNAL